MIQFDDYHNKFLNRILRLTEAGVIHWEIVKSLNSKRYRGIGNNHVFTVKIFDTIDKDNYIGYISKSVASFEILWKFVIEEQEIIDCFISNLVDHIETKKHWLPVEKVNRNFVEPETGEILLNDNAGLAKNYFDDLIISNTYKVLNNFMED